MRRRCLRNRLPDGNGRIGCAGHYPESRFAVFKVEPAHILKISLEKPSPELFGQLARQFLYGLFSISCFWTPLLLMFDNPPADLEVSSERVTHWRSSISGLGRSSKRGLLSRAPLKESISMINTEDDSMSAAENIPVSKETYNQILDLRAPGETLDETLARLVEKVKKQRLTDDIEEVMARNEFVELDL